MSASVVAKTAPRRDLNFDTIDDVLADLDRLERGPRTTIGGWSGGQIFEHLARFVDCSLDGFPMTLPLWLRLFGRMMKGKFLNGKMPTGIKLKGESADAFIPGPTAWEDGLAHYRRSLARLKTEPQRHSSPFFGKLSHAEWDLLHRRHAELHLSFIQS